MGDSDSISTKRLDEIIEVLGEKDPESELLQSILSALKEYKAAREHIGIDRHGFYFKVRPND